MKVINNILLVGNAFFALVQLGIMFVHPTVLGASMGLGNLIAVGLLYHVNKLLD